MRPISWHIIEMDIICVMNDILLALDQRKFVFLVLLELSAAFDIGGHQSLLGRLSSRISLDVEVGTDLSYWYNSMYLHLQREVGVSSANERCAPRFCAWSYLFHHLYTASGGHCSEAKHGVSLIDWWHSVVSLIQRSWSSLWTGCPNPAGIMHLWYQTLDAAK